MHDVDEPRTLDIAREVLADVDELRGARLRVGYVGGPPGRGGRPALVVVWERPGVRASPALAVYLESFATGLLHPDDALRGVIRRAVERYLTVTRPPVLASSDG